MEPEAPVPTGPATLELELDLVMVIEVVHEVLALPAPATLLDVNGYGEPVPVATLLTL